MNTYYALVNLNSESVRDHIGEIEARIAHLSARLGAPIASDYAEIYKTYNESWRNVDLQFEKARGYTYLLVFGGDGTQTHVLNLIARSGVSIRFIGISCGTMNISPFSNKLRDLETCDHLQCVSRDAILCTAADGQTSFAFTDAVITTTCVARIDGAVSQFSAADILNGVKKRAIPAAIGNGNTKIVIQRPGQWLFLPTMPEIFTVSAAFLPAALKAQVLAGGADPAACAGFTWGLILSDFPLVWADAAKEDIQRRPISSVFYPLEAQDRVLVTQLNKNAYLVNDGNAICRAGSVEFSFQPGCLKTYQLTEGPL